ncbi:MAG: phosphotransferase [Pseudomonadota bacterium]
MTFPTQPEELTSSWLSTTLNGTVSDFEVEFFGEGAGIIGMVTRLHLKGENVPDTIIAKFPSPSPENRAVAATYDMYGREHNFYQGIAASVDIRVPACYHTQFAPEPQDFVILMEDMVGWRIGDQVQGCSSADAACVIEGVAGLHASSWDTNANLVSHNNPAQAGGMSAGFGVGWPVVSQQFADLIPAAARNVGDQVPGKVQWLLDQITQPPVSIAHADVRLDNVFFKEGEIALVDWQSVCTSAPEQDVAYFVTQSLSQEVRQSADWVALYHQALLDRGVTNYSLEQCRERYRLCAAYLLCYATIIAGTLDLANERGLLLGRTLFGNAMASLEELDAFSLFA